MTEQRIIFALLANQLKDIHHALEEYILADKYQKPRWDVHTREGGQQIVERLAPLLNLGMMLQDFADEERAGTVMLPAVDTGNG